MSVPHTTRRQAVAVSVLIWLLVCGGLAWATRSAILVEAVEERVQGEVDEERLRALALSRLDALAELVVGPERSRSYDHYRAFYKPAEARDTRDNSEVHTHVVVPSPLRGLPGPNWMLLHFQASEILGWSSPQSRAIENYPDSAAKFAADGRLDQAGPENWLVALRERYTATELLYLLEQAQETERKRRQFSGLHNDRGTEHATVPTAEPTPNGAQDPRARAVEFARRGARLLRVQRETFPLDTCEPETVALENLEVGEELSRVAAGGKDCVLVTKSQMIPLWLDLTLDGRQQLALVRSASVETSHYCTLQGVLIDWERLSGALEAEVRDIFPKAQIVPVTAAAPLNPQLAASMMQTIPARLESGPSPHHAASVSDALKTGLAVAWLTSLLGLTAVTYGVFKVVNMTERRMRFVSAVTHELRTPLTSFQLYSDLLADMPREDSSRRKDYAGALRGEARRLSRLVENVLAYSRIGDARLRMNLASTAPSVLLEAVRGAMDERCAAAGKELVLTDSCPSGFAVETDAELVLQILINLVENACKYSADARDPSIWVSASPTPEGLLLEVEDAGAGVPARDRRGVFEPFRRSDSASNGSSGGVGLGLTMSRYWAGCLGGRLTLRHGERNPSAYACFSLALPVQVRA